MFLRRLALSCAVCFLGVSHVAAQGTPVDVYFIAGQSNASQFAKDSGTGSTNLGFDLHFARTNESLNSPGYTGIAQSFTSSSVSSSFATSILASELHQEGRDVAIFSFARNGAALNLGGNTNVWYAGSDPAGGELYQDSLYANSVVWFTSRLDELRADGFAPEVKGLFWFQGERDALQGKIAESDGGVNDHLLYGENFDNLVFRFRQDFGENLPIVAARIREFSDDGTENVINDSLAQAAAADPFMSVVATQDLEFRNTLNVHLTNNREHNSISNPANPAPVSGLATLAPRWSAEMLNIQSPPTLLGDCNLDGAVNFLDIGPFVSRLLNDDYLAEADANRDGILTFLDIGPFVTLLSR